MERNALRPEDMVSCIFTCTDDLDAEFPAVAARRLGLSAVPLLCAREIGVPGSLPRVIRLLLHCYTEPDSAPQHVYLGEAVALRRDLEGPSEPGVQRPRARHSRLPGGSQLQLRRRAREARIQRVPWPPHPKVLEVVEAELRTLNRYPDPEKTMLRRRIADRTGWSRGGWRSATARASLLLAAAEAMLEPGAELVYAWPSFSIYPHLAAMSGARAITVPLDADGVHDLEAMAREVTRHAPRRGVQPQQPERHGARRRRRSTGSWPSIPRHVAVILDEAYVEFSTLQDPDDSLDLLARHPNLVVLRTFSKVYGLCGLRAGYALGSEDFRRAVDRVRQPFSVNALAQAAAAEALLHQDEVERRVERTAIERLHVETALADRGFEATDSQANFSWVSLGERDEAEVVEGLARRGVIVRRVRPSARAGRLRVTYGTRRENDRFLRALDELA